MSLAADPDRKIPSYGWICMDWLMKDFQLPLFSTRSGHQFAERHSGTNEVTFPFLLTCASTRVEPGMEGKANYSPFQCYVHSGSLSTLIFRRRLSTCYVTRPACPHTEMVKTLSEDLRWRVIYHRYIYGSSIEDTA